MTVVHPPLSLPVENVHLLPIGPQAVGFPFIVSGTFYFAIEDVDIQLADDTAAAFAPASAAVQFTPSTFSFTHPPIMTPGEHTVTVSVAGTSLSIESNTFEVNPVYV